VRRSGFALLLAFVGLLACARRVAPPLPQGEDYLFPSPAPRELSVAEAKALQQAWLEILADDVPAAGRRLEKLRRQGGGRPSIETAIGYARLRAGRAADALAAFEAAIERSPAFVPALVGAGSAALRRNDPDAALDFYRSALAAAPGDAVVRKRVAALKLQVTERHMARAQAAVEAGDPSTAVREYRGALGAAPEVSGVRLALAELLAREGDGDAAIALLEADPTGERSLRLRLAAALTGAGRLDRAGAVYRELLARDPSDAEAQAGQLLVRERVEAAGMPEEYRRIPDAARLSRADLAALLMVRVKALRGAGPGEPRVAVDIGGSWAREQIAGALSLDVLDLYPNHSFQPGALVRRVDLARAVARVLDLMGWPRAAAPAPADMPRSHLDYDAVVRSLGAGLLTLGPTGGFEPWRTVSGREALAVIDALARLVGP
jgi:tetratricopeptide (TPR) repeat protein